MTLDENEAKNGESALLSEEKEDALGSSSSEVLNTQTLSL